MQTAAPVKNRRQPSCFSTIRTLFSIFTRGTMISCPHFSHRSLKSKPVRSTEKRLQPHGWFFLSTRISPTETSSKTAAFPLRAIEKAALLPPFPVMFSIAQNGFRAQRPRGKNRSCARQKPKLRAAHGTVPAAAYYKRTVRAGYARIPPPFCAAGTRGWI